MMRPNKTALVYAVDLLAVRAYSTKMLADKLLRKGYEKEEIQAAMEILLARGYLNDEVLCQSVYRQYIAAAKYSVKQIECKLLQKGFTNQTIASGRQAEDEAAEKIVAAKLLYSKYSSAGETDEMKMMQFLYGKGFVRKSIIAAVSAFVKKDCQLSIEED